MALLTSELRRIRVELGYNALNAGAEPYIGVHAMFETVIAAFLQAGATTSSITNVVAASAPTPVAITLTDATGFSAGDVVVLDVDSRQERATIQALSGSSMTVQLMGAHSGASYPVTVEGGEAIVRDILRKLYSLSNPGGQLEGFASTAGLKRAEDIEWYANGSGGSSQFDDLKKLRMYWRDELASALGVTNLWRYRGGGGRSEFY
jgi:hypothetical protein